MPSGSGKPQSFKKLPIAEIRADEQAPETTVAAFGAAAQASLAAGPLPRHQPDPRGEVASRSKRSGLHDGGAGPSHAPERTELTVEGGPRVRIPFPPAESHVAQCWMATGGKRCCRWVWSGALVLARSVSLVGCRRGSNDDAGRSADPRARSACPRGVYPEGRQDRTNHNSIINEAALLEVTPCEGVSVAVKIHSPWISGRAPSRVAATSRRPRLGPCWPLQRAALAGSGAILLDDAVGLLQQ
jgi:hypothetical protein